MEFLIILALIIFVPIGFVLFILVNKKLGTPSQRLFYIAFWLFFWFVLSFPNYYLSFLIIGDNCTYTAEGKAHCSMVIPQLTLGITMAMFESLGLLWYYHKSPRFKKNQETPDDKHEDGIKSAVLWGIGLIILGFFIMFIAKSLGL